MTYQSAWISDRLIPKAQNEGYARVRLVKLMSSDAWQAVLCKIPFAIARLAAPGSSPARPDFDRQLRNDMRRIEARRLL